MNSHSLRSSVRTASFLFASFSLALGCVPSRDEANANASALPAPTAAPASLAAAHDAFLRGDMIATGEKIHDVLVDPGAGELARENALELLDKAYERENGKLPSRFVLPAGFDSMKIAAHHGRSPYGDFHGVWLFMRVRDGLAARLTDVTVRRLPNETLLDRASGRGTFRVRHNSPGFEDLLLQVTNLDGLADGVLSIRVAVDGAPVIDTWVPARRMMSSTTPEVLTPTPTSTFADDMPQLRWVPFRSPEYAAFEERTHNVYVGDESGQKAAWDVWIAHPGEIDGIRIGAHEGAPVVALKPGAYSLELGAGEDRFFGPIAVTRNSQTTVPFNVALR